MALHVADAVNRPSIRTRHARHRDLAAEHTRATAPQDAYWSPSWLMFTALSHSACCAGLPCAARTGNLDDQS